MIAHALTYKTGRLIIAWHNGMCCKIIHHAVQALSPSNIWDEPLIFRNRGAEVSKPFPYNKRKDIHTVSSAAHILDGADVKHPEAIRGDSGGVLFHNFWMNGTNGLLMCA